MKKALSILLIIIMALVSTVLGVTAAEKVESPKIDDKVKTLIEENDSKEIVKVYVFGAYDFERDLGLGKKEKNELIDTWLDEEETLNAYTAMEIEYYSEKNPVLFDEISAVSPKAEWIHTEVFRVVGEEVAFMYMQDEVSNMIKISLPVEDIEKIAVLDSVASIAYCPTAEVSEVDMNDKSEEKTGSVVITGGDDGYTFEYLRGDADNDGEVTILDATMIQRELVNITQEGSYRIDNADYDDDGEVTILDATGIQRNLAGID